MPSAEVLSWVRTRFMPHIWCPGCGHGIIMHALIRALVALKKEKSNTVLASGIGSSSRMAGYINACTLHSTHGRSLAFATGIKLHRPELTVVDVMGDGDCTAIGGNHFIHACRRNIDITAIVMNNNIYGMTGGQMAPTTLLGQRATTCIGGRDPKVSGYPIRVSEMLATLAGPAYIERVALSQPKYIMQAKAAIKKAFKNQVDKKGFSPARPTGACVLWTP